MIAVTESELSACEFRHWFPLFSSSKITFPSRIINLPSAFVHYLESDGIKLPAGLDGREASALSDDEDLVEVLSKEAAEEDVSFSQLNEEIRVFMRELGGEVFIKLNWSCPSDAVWMNGGSLRCTRLEEVYLLLKSSDRILFDLNHTILPSAAPSPSIEAENASSSSRPSPPRHSMDHTLSSSPFTLILRKWRRDLPSSMEFRCFVLHRSLVAVSQRDCSSFFPFLPAEKQRVLSLVVPFFKNHIVSNFPLESYTFDIVIDVREKVWLVDFNVFGPPTNALLFEWSELLFTMAVNNSVSDGDGHAILNTIDYRVVQGKSEALSSEAGLYRGPIDASLSKDFPNFISLCKQQALQDSDEDSDD